MSLTVAKNRQRLLKKMGLNKPKPKDDDVKEDPCWDTHKQVGMKKKNGKMVPNCVPKEEIEEINLPALIKSVIHRATHPKGYAKMLQAYIAVSYTHLTLPTKA